MSEIIHIPESASIALHSMALIANSEEQMNANQIAELTKASRNHIAKVLHSLVKFGYLQSNRGPKGGFTLHPNAKNANLLEIYEAIEGSIIVDQCKKQHKNCPFKKCIFGGLIEKFTNEFKDYLSQKSINDIIVTK